MDQYVEFRKKALPILRPDLSRMSVFGSTVRGDATKKSDLDLLIRLKPSGERPKFGLFKLMENVFLSNSMAHDAGVRQIEIIGESARNVSAEFQENYPKLPWAK